MHKKTIFSLGSILAGGLLLLQSCSKTPPVNGQKVAPQEFISSTEMIITPVHATGEGIHTSFHSHGDPIIFYVDGGTGKYYAIKEGDTVVTDVPTIEMHSDMQYRFQINFRGEDGQNSNDEYTDESDPESGANIHQFFFVPVATGAVNPVNQENDEGDPLKGYVNLEGLSDQGGLDYNYADSSADGTSNLKVGLNGFFKVVKGGQKFDLVVDLRHGIQDKFEKNYPWYDDAFSRSGNDVNAPYGATDFATMFHLHVITKN